MANSALLELPHWQLRDLFDAENDPPLAEQLREILADAENLAQNYKARLHELDAATLNAVLMRYQSISARTARLTSYADLAFAGDMGDAGLGKQAQDTNEAGDAIDAVLVFVAHELIAMDEARMRGLLAEAPMKHWAPWLRVLRASRPHQLSLELETMLIDRQTSGRGAWVRLFDALASRWRYAYQGRDCTEAEILDLLTDADAETRRQAGAVRAEVLAEHGATIGLIFNTIAKDKQVEDKWRQFPHPVSARNLANDVEDDVVDALVANVSEAMPRLSHRYYALKARALGRARLNWWDLHAPFSEEDDRKFSWHEARDIVRAAFGGFDAEFADLADAFFARNWIDAPPRAGKVSGAFSHPTAPSVHPYILLNFHGKARDVMTLAHELGHGVHQILAGEQGHIMASTPLTLAETASVFGEMLVFQHLMAETDTPQARRGLLAHKIEDMLGTVTRQIGFHNFELRFHQLRKHSEVTADTIGDIWLETQRQTLGPAVDLDASYRPLWGGIPHFFHAPFYVYAYAFGDGLVGALWQKYQNADDNGNGDAGGRAEFVDAYKNLLRAGGTKRHDEVLAPFGLDARDAAFWQLGLDMIAGMIDQLESELGYE